MATLPTADLTRDFLPVAIDKNAAIAKYSSVKQVGKVPSNYDGEGYIYGISQWTQYEATAAEVRKWRKNKRLGLCIQTRRLRVIDIDVDDPIQANKLVEAVLSKLPPKFDRIPIRSREGTGRCVLAFVVEPGEPLPKRVFAVKDTEKGLVEFLADGRQFVAEGLHASSGTPYTWVDGYGDATDTVPERFPILTREQFEAIWKYLVEQFAVPGSAKTSGVHGIRKSGVTNKEAAANDATYAWLLDHGLIMAEYAGGASIECPFSHTHTTPDAPGSTATMYWPAGTGREGSHAGNFKCLHGHCEDRTTADFVEALPGCPNPWGRESQLKPIELDEDEEPPRKKKAAGLGRVNGYGYDLAAIRAAQFKPLRWLLPGIVPEGMLSLAGPWKLGKSWLALGLAVACATGGTFLEQQAKQTNVLLLALEDGKRRMQRRLLSIEAAMGCEVPEGAIHVVHKDEWEWSGLDAVRALEQYLIAHPTVKLVIVDLFNMVRPPSKQGAYTYDEDRRDCDPYVALAAAHQVTILVVSHTIKQTTATEGMEAKDMVRGAIVGAVDNYLILLHPRGAKPRTAVLSVGGKEADHEQAIPCELDARGQWLKMAGSVEELMVTETQKKILEALRESPGGLTTKGVIEAMGDAYSHSIRASRSRMLSHMAQDNIIVREGALYKIRDAAPEQKGILAGLL